MDTPKILTPDCPMCGNPPAFTFITPYFCQTEGCKVIAWDPYMTLAEIRAAQPTEITFDPIFEKPSTDA